MKTKNKIAKDNIRLIKCPFCGFEFIKTVEVDNNKSLKMLSCPKCGKTIDRIAVSKKEL